MTRPEHPERKMTTTMTTIQRIPRAYLRASLRLTRVPIDLARRVTGNQDNDQWSPVLAYDSFQANAKQVLGSLLGDDELVHQGEQEFDRVQALREAQNLEAVAAQTKAGAEQSFQERRAADERKREAAEGRAVRRQQAAERKRSDAKQKAAAETRARKERAHRLEQTRQADIDRTERAAKADHLQKERAALTASKRASATKARAVGTDKELRATKATRSRAARP